VNKRKLIIISDLHIGGDKLIKDFSCDKELISFLNEKGKYEGDLELIILGDFFDLWKVEETIDEQLDSTIEEYKDLFNALKNFGEKHKITILPGNHDHELFYNKKYQEDLAMYNIMVDASQFFKRKFVYNGKVFRIIGEHGNQVEPSTKFQSFDMFTNSSLAYHFNKIFVYKLMRMGMEHKSPAWLKDMDNVDTEIVPYWILSKYFYYELGPILRAVLIPMLILFSFALPYFIFDVVTEFYQPHFLKPLLIFLDTNTFSKVVIFLLYFDMVIVTILAFFWFVKRDFKKNLLEYGVHSFSEILVARHNAYRKRAKEVIDGKNSFKEKADFYVTGHTHIAGLYESYKFADSGSWKQLMKRISTKFRFPSVYVPYFNLTYLIFEPNGDDMVVSLKSWPKYFEPKLTVLERFTVRNKDLPKSIKKDTIISESRFKFS